MTNETLENQDAVVDMGGSQDIVLVQSLYQQLSDLLEAGTPVSFDVRETERLDTAVAQLLLSFTQAAREKNQSVTWLEPSDAFNTSVRLLGIGAALGVAA